MLNNRGYDVTSEEEYYDGIMQELKKQFPTMSESPSNLVSIIARIIARNENRRDYDRVRAYSEAYIATATGMHLSKAVATAGITRLKGTRAVGVVKITKDPAVPQIILPPKMLINSEDLQYYVNNNDALIVDNESITIQIVSTDVGDKYNISSGSKFNSVMNIRGIKSIEATTDISGGSNVETDKALRDRYFLRMSSYTNSSLKGIIDRVSSIPEVYMVDGRENWTDQEKETLPPHSFEIFVAGGTNKDIANAIIHSKPAGIQPHGKITESIIVSGRKYDVKFSRFEEVDVYFDIEVVIDKATSSPEFIDDLKEKVAEYTNSTNKLVAYELSNFISQEMEEVRGVKKLNFGYSPNPSSNDDLIAPAGQHFNSDTKNIEVKVV